MKIINRKKSTAPNKFTLFSTLIEYFIWRFFESIDSGVSRFFSGFVSLLSRPFSRNKEMTEFDKLVMDIKQTNELEKQTVVKIKTVDFNSFDINRIFSSSIHVGLYFLFMWSLVDIATLFFPDLGYWMSPENEYRIPMLLALCYISMVISNIFTLDKKRRDKYYKKFDKIKGVKRFLYKLITLILVIGMPVWWIFTMTLT